MLIFKKEKKKEKKKKALDVNTNSALETRLEFAREYVETPKLKTLDPNPSSLSPLPSDQMLILKKRKKKRRKKKKGVRHKHKLSLKTRLEFAREYVGNPKTENLSRKSFSLVATSI